MQKRGLILLVALLLAVPLGFAIGQAAQERDYGVDLQPAGEGSVTFTATVPITDEALGELGLDGAVEAVEIRSALTTLGFAAGALGGLVVQPGLNYTCDSGENQCTCDARDPLDCIEIYEECTGPLHPPGRPDEVCLPGTSGTCVCTWH